MSRISPARIVVASVALAGVATGVAFLVAGRRRAGGTRPEDAAIGDRPAAASPAWLRRFVTRRWNPVVERLALVGGRRSPWAYLEHVGRSSGALYRTPVLPALVGVHVFVPLPYGVDVHWTRNVLAAGHCRLQVHETTYELDEPFVVTAAGRHDLPERLRAWAEARGNRYLRLHVLASRDGRLDDAPVGGTAAEAAPGEIAAPA